MRRPDLVDVWPFRVADGRPEVLLLRRAPGRVLAGLWQGVSGAVESGEEIIAAALRELREETGFGGPVVEALYSLDYVAEFLWERADALVTSAYFAARVLPGSEPVLSHEHDAYRWLPIADAAGLAVWPAYREALGRVRDNLLDAGRAPWFEVPLAARLDQPIEAATNQEDT